MTVENFWILFVAGATSAASSVGFLIQVWSARKTALEIEKLKLEIAALREAQRSARSRIALPTSEEVKDVVRAQRHYTRDKAPSSGNRPIQSEYGILGVLLGILALAGYLLWKHFIG
ncbi:hypothetical protein ACUXAV_005926 [Cupriavidus metallidurans]|jgi:hypothetical protein|uniref:Uncharacterized protein n=1 Tax=Cupriavidus metallidurans (strain ATCC 43123 / DSM 2839 / NBRC 102507 / CH34) TaxID=266264 RepID=Q1L9I5_CUPMC|nr:MULTISPECIES: hypothetical protein [Cupriavidus]ABF13191.1 hypothetical protein Rmet_6332 [Cupriavidus metallidurans CH34]KAB0597106.1 hypothetical protein F7R19_26970 [Cupriavidus pauculus]MDE4922802.1 hypothetical protein [Cupriavidus metallidurans]QGS27473.1 hypothetical protein FOB83_00585 [Cupriavidus metallidurans]UAL03945.1 hypothetical protein K8O84_29400 [Cupriavidus pauculus]